ncbi:MAG: hypothetical protein HC904_04685 [Blastochloris sp.]|nr:hypothetical protein [Blastochloris sp.]
MKEQVRQVKVGDVGGKAQVLALGLVFFSVIFVAGREEWTLPVLMVLTGAFFFSETKWTEGEPDLVDCLFRSGIGLGDSISART